MNISSIHGKILPNISDDQITRDVMEHMEREIKRLDPFYSHTDFSGYSSKQLKTLFKEVLERSVENE